LKKQAQFLWKKRFFVNFFQSNSCPFVNNYAIFDNNGMPQDFIQFSGYKIINITGNIITQHY